MKKLYLLLLCFLYTVVSCSEEPPEPETIDFKQVRIRWTGDYHTDGCGFFVEIGSIRHKPINEDFLSAEFRTSNDTIVEMRYLDLNREIISQCGEGLPFKIRGIEIIDIK